MLNLTQTLEYSLYILNQSNTSHKDRQRVRISQQGVEFYEKPDLEGIMEKELQAVSRRLLITGV